MEIPNRTISSAEALTRNRKERRRLGKLNGMKIPSIINLKKVQRDAGENQNHV